MDNVVERVTKWRRTTKEALVNGFGGGCNRCGYSRCYDALDLHHLDPSKKSFGIGKIMANPKKWSVIVEEAKKCILLCKICHTELHAGMWELSEIEIVEFQYEEKKYKKDIPTGQCVVCNKDVFLQRICCSLECAALRTNKIVWPSKEELQEMLKVNSRRKVATLLGVSDSAVRKREIKLGLLI